MRSHRRILAAIKRYRYRRRDIVETALAAALDVEEMARVIVAAMYPGAGHGPTKIDRRIATALRAAILGGAA